MNQELLKVSYLIFWRFVLCLMFVSIFVMPGIGYLERGSFLALPLIYGLFYASILLALYWMQKRKGLKFVYEGSSNES